MTISNYAMIPNSSTQVFNTIVANEDFKMDGYFFILIGEDVFCETGDFYNKNDGKFYEDENFTVLAGTVTTSDED